MYIYTYTYISIHMCIHIYYICIKIYIYLHICIHICMDIHMHIYFRMPITHRKSHLIFKQMHIYTLMHTYRVATISMLLKIISLFSEYRLFHRALLQKRPTILRSLRIVDFKEPTNRSHPISASDG